MEDSILITNPVNQLQLIGEEYYLMFPEGFTESLGWQVHDSINIEVVIDNKTGNKQLLLSNITNES